MNRIVLNNVIEVSGVLRLWYNFLSFLVVMIFFMVFIVLGFGCLWFLLFIWDCSFIFIVLKGWLISSWVILVMVFVVKFFLIFIRFLWYICFGWDWFLCVEISFIKCVGLFFLLILGFYVFMDYFFDVYFYEFCVYV